MTNPDAFLLVCTCYVVAGAPLTITFNLQKYKTLQMTNNIVPMLLTIKLSKQKMSQKNTYN